MLIQFSSDQSLSRAEVKRVSLEGEAGDHASERRVR